MRDESLQPFERLPVDGAPCQAYSEGAFRYFLGVERKRAERSSRSVLLLLVGPEDGDAGAAPLDAGLAAKVFSALAVSIRDVDFVGWYREARVAGAVLTQGGDLVTDDMFHCIRQRVQGALTEQLPERAAARLEVRVVHLRPKARG